MHCSIHCKIFAVHNTGKFSVLWACTFILSIFGRFQVATVIDGRAMAKCVKDEVRAEVKQWVSEGHRPPCLIAILVGTAAASDTYVRYKMKAADYIGSLLLFSV